MDDDPHQVENALADNYQMKADELAAQIDQDKARLVALLAGVFSTGSDRI